MAKKDQHQSVLLDLHRDRKLAHAVLFKHRHPLPTTKEHGQMIEDFHSHNERYVEEAFRGFGKSTVGEEAVAICGAFVDFTNCLIVSSTQTRAAERLEAVKHELENNDVLIEVFGQQVGEVWQAYKIVTQNNVCIQAIGVGQAVRGVKHHENRPDFLWIDDIEDEESVKTPEACHDRLKWLYGTLLPVCAKHARIRVTGNRLSPDAVVTKLSEDRSWISRRYPICYLDVGTGAETATWPELRDMAWIHNARDEYYRLGLEQTWASEYMCEAQNELAKSFKPEDYRVIPRIRVWEPMQVMYDPAKTSKDQKQQAHYGKALFSWVGNRLVVWDGFTKAMQPSELFEDIFKTEQQHGLMTIGLEKDGLEEWLSEPLRAEQLRRRTFLPQIEYLKAPKDKFGFIRALQPHATSGMIEFAKDMPEFRAQLINFPSGRIDGLNALAYALTLRPGQPVYDGFHDDHVSEGLNASLRSKPYLCLNSDGTNVTGVLVQYDGALAIIADWIEGGDPGQHIEAICKQASLLAGNYQIIVPPKEFDPYDNKGTVAAVRRLPREVAQGSMIEKGRAELRDLLGRRSQNPLLMVSSSATWTLRAFSGGYCKAFNRSGMVDGEPKVGAYRTLMESLESFAGMMHYQQTEGEEVGLFRTSRHGSRYRSLIGDRHARA